MEREGKGAQYIPVWLTKKQWSFLMLDLAGSPNQALSAGSVETICDAIEWAEGR